jgi:hypothetical protein
VPVRIVIYIVKRIHAEDVTRPTVHPASNGWQSMPHGMCETGVTLSVMTRVA